MATSRAVAAGRRARTKGKTWERAVVRWLRATWPRAYRGHQDSRGGSGGGEGCDVEGTPLYVECRHEREYQWRRHLREALSMRARRQDQRPLALVAKEDKRPPGWRVGQPTTPPIVVMLFDEWRSLVHELEAWRRMAQRQAPHAAEGNGPPWELLELELEQLRRTREE